MVDVDGVVEAAPAVGVEVLAQVGQVVPAPPRARIQRQERGVRRDDALPVVGRRRRAAPATGSRLEAVVDQRPLLVGGIAVRLEADRVDAILAVAAGGVVGRREAPVAVLGFLQAVLDLRPNIQRVIDAPARRPHSSSGTNSGTISASNMLPPQRRHDVHPAIGVVALEHLHAQVGARYPSGFISCQLQSQVSGKVRHILK